MITKKAKYALNALVYLAKEYNKGPVLISQIAENERIPQKFLELILLDLKRVGILGSKKGKGGGYYLIKSPDNVNVADILRHFDGPIALLPCVSEKYYERCEECKDEEHCGIRSVMRRVREATLKILQNSSLQDIISNEDLLSSKNS